jgi:SagB-type dehydrogenase family enzyme
MRSRSGGILQEFQAPASSEREALSAVFHEHSKLTPRRRLQLGERIAQLQAGGLVARMARSHKSYPALPQFDLPPAERTPTRGLRDVIARRRSQRAFDPERTVTAAELGTILQLCYGITGTSRLGEGVTQYMRAVPSGGGLYPLELYLVVQRVDGIPSGLYHYRVGRHALEQLEAGDQTEWLARSETEWGMSASAAFVLVIAAVFARSTVKYRERGYRFVLFEAGLVAGQAGLVAECQGLHSCQMGGFVDDELSAVFGLDGTDEAAILPVCFGR